MFRHGKNATWSSFLCALKSLEGKKVYAGGLFPFHNSTVFLKRTGIRNRKEVKGLISFLSI